MVINDYAKLLKKDSNNIMTLEKVQEIYPNAVIYTMENSANDGSKELLRINEIILSAEPFRVSFFFKDKDMTRIYLSPNRDYNRTTGNRVFNNLNRSLTAIYGQSVNSEVKTNSMFPTKNVSWLSEGIDIFLASTIIGDKNTIYVLYYIKY